MRYPLSELPTSHRKDQLYLQFSLTLHKGLSVLDICSKLYLPPHPWNTRLELHLITQSSKQSITVIMMAQEARQYELILLGATGYTGKLVAEWVTTHLPEDLKWAVAGRNAKKLQSVVDELMKLRPDRKQPGAWLTLHFPCTAQNHVNIRKN